MWIHVLILVEKNNMASEQLTLARLSSSVVASLFSADITLLLGEDFSTCPLCCGEESPFLSYKTQTAGQHFMHCRKIKWIHDYRPESGRLALVGLLTPLPLEVETIFS